MKKIIYILLVVFVAFSCRDFNVDEDWLDDSGKPTNVAAYEYTMTDADFTTIANGLRANKTKADSLRATQLLALKKFTPDFKPSELIPYLLDSKYFTADLKSSAKITYKYDAARDAVVSALSGAGYLVTVEDYKTAWGSLSTNSFNPEKKPETYIPNILKTKYPDAVDGSYITVEYNYSEENSVSANVENRFFYEDFESYNTDETNISGWINKDLINTRTWGVKSFSNNKYMQMQGSSSQANDCWLITKKIDLSASANDPKFLFDITVGFWKYANLSVLISTDFDGIVTNILSATWTDVSGSFTIPTTPTDKYGTMGPAGSMNMNTYKGKSFYIAYRYQSTPGLTTTFQVDKVKVAEIIPGIDVPNKAPQYAVYTYSDGVWKKAATNIITLQPVDYAKLEITTNTMTAAEAKDLLPQYLVRNVIGKEGTEKTLVYRTKAGEFYAEKYTFRSGTWVLNTTLSDQTSQFVRGWDDDAKKKKWVFDPTIIFGMAKSDYNLMVEYSREHNAPGNEGIYVTNANGNSEFYYGFAARYNNVTYRNGDRSKDKTYPAEASDAEKITFMNQRVKDGLAILLTLKYPNATPEVSGVKQFAEIRNLTIFSEPGIVLPNNNGFWTYTFQCVGNKEWKFISRTSLDGRSEVAPK